MGYAVDTQLVIDPVYPCKVCKVNRPMHYTPEMSHGIMPDGLDLLTCWVCKTTQVRDQQERLKLRASIRKAWGALADDIAEPVDKPVDNFIEGK